MSHGLLRPLADASLALFLKSVLAHSCHLSVVYRVSGLGHPVVFSKLCFQQVMLLQVLFLQLLVLHCVRFVFVLAIWL